VEIVRDDVPENEVVLRFLEAEIDKEHLRAVMFRLGIPRSLVMDANLDDASQNEQRALALRYHRGYPDASLFEGFPRDVHWSVVRVSRDELLDALYITFEGWDRISGGTREVREGARRLVAGEVEGETLGKFASRPGFADVLGGLMAVSDGEKVVWLEGHHRATTIALHPEQSPESFEIYLGRSYGFAQWKWF
jgi:hypothetical protein